MTAPQQSHQFRRWLDEDASVTVEFVIIFPLILALVFMIIFISMLIAAASDVQQIAHELARSAFGYLGRNPTPADVCSLLRTQVLPELLEQSRFLNPAKMALTPCPGLPDAAGYIRIEVSYNFAGDFVQGIGEMLNVDLGIIKRTAVTKLGA